MVMGQGTFWVINILVLAVVVGWAVEILRRLGDQTKLLRQIADELRLMRGSLGNDS